MRWRFALATILFLPTLTAAQVITEVMYDLREGSDSGREWIEVYNSSTASIDLVKWKIVENGKSHKITAVAGSFGPGSFAIIADNAVKFQADHPEYASALFDSVFSLNNKSETVALADAAGKESDSVIYTSALGGNGTGDSLQKTDPSLNAALSPGMPTPGAGVPAGGLALTPQAEKASKKSPVKNKAAAVVQSTIVKGIKKDSIHKESQVAMTITTDPENPYLWLLGVFAIAACGAFGVSYARRTKKTEWDIIEET
jgi:hypothetical protein